MSGVHTRVENVDGDALSSVGVDIPVVVDGGALIDEVEAPSGAIPVVVFEHLLGGGTGTTGNQERRRDKDTDEHGRGEAPTRIQQMPWDG